MPEGKLQTLRTSELALAYEEQGPPDGWPVVLLHGFPYDVRAFDGVAPVVAGHGARVVTPYLRGFGPTRTVDMPGVMRSGQQAAIGRDLVELLEGLRLAGALLAGFDWGNRAACVAAALRPDLVAGGGHAIQHIASAAAQQPAEREWRLWYQFYFCTERGRRALAEDRRGFCEFLWRLWSPQWRFGADEFERSTASFDSPDFVDVVIHSYRHRLGLAAGAARHEADELRLAQRPPIEAPVIVLEGDADGVAPPDSGVTDCFHGWHEHRVLRGAGHNFPQERPLDFAQAVLDLRSRTDRAQRGRNRNMQEQHP